MQIYLHIVVCCSSAVAFLDVIGGKSIGTEVSQHSCTCVRVPVYSYFGMYVYARVYVNVCERYVNIMNCVYVCVLVCECVCICIMYV